MYTTHTFNYTIYRFGLWDREIYVPSRSSIMRTAEKKEWKRERERGENVGVGEQEKKRFELYLARKWNFLFTSFAIHKKYMHIYSINPCQRRWAWNKSIKFQWHLCMLLNAGHYFMYFIFFSYCCFCSVVCVYHSHNEFLRPFIHATCNARQKMCSTLQWKK